VVALAGCTDDGGSRRAHRRRRAPHPDADAHRPPPVVRNRSEHLSRRDGPPGSHAQDAALEASRAVVPEPLPSWSSRRSTMSPPQLTAASAPWRRARCSRPARRPRRPTLLRSSPSWRRLDVEAVLAVGAVTLTPPAAVTVVPVPAGAGADALRARDRCAGSRRPPRCRRVRRPLRSARSPAPTGRPRRPRRHSPVTHPDSERTDVVDAVAPPGASAGGRRRHGRAHGVGCRSARRAGPPLPGRGGCPCSMRPAATRATTPVSGQVIASAAPEHTIALGAAFGRRTSSPVASRPRRPGCSWAAAGQLIFPQVPGLPGKKYVALYGTPGSSALGVLGSRTCPRRWPAPRGRPRSTGP
jgi:hypothetical protein